MRSITPSLICALILLTGCQSPYGKDRARDFQQSLDLSAAYSEGFGFNLRASKLVQVGIGGYRGVYWVGLEDGDWDMWEEERTEIGMGPIYLHEVFRRGGSKILDIQTPLYGDPGFREYAWDVVHATDRGFFDIGATGNVALVGVNFAFSPAEFADFLCGIFGYDLLQDDIHSPTLSELGARLNHDDPWIRASGIRGLREQTGRNFGYRFYTAPDQMPLSQIQAVGRWREFLRLGAPDRVEVEPVPVPEEAEEPEPVAEPEFDPVPPEPPVEEE